MCVVPAVMLTTKAELNTWKAPMMLVITRNRSVGESRGRVMRQNFVHVPAPSISAASCRCLGTAVRPASKMSTGLPIYQRPITIRPFLAHAGS